MSEMADLILKADLFQNHSENAHRCPDHGEKMWPHASGSVLMCVQRGCNFHLGLQPHMVSTDAE
jgi:hypothetical protein